MIDQTKNDRTAQKDLSMYKELITGIAVGGLLHDIGKFAERSSLYAKGNEEEIKKNFRWDHPYHTAQVLTELFPESADKVVGHELVGESTLRDLAARHHLPRMKIQSFIQVADWHAAGHERVRSDLESNRYAMQGKSTKNQQPLISILSRINLPELKDVNAGPDMFYKIQVAALEREASAQGMHPCSSDKYPSPDVQKAYKSHWQSFAKMLTPEPDAPFPLDLIENFDTILEVCRLYQWCLPETTRRQDLSDVSLFEHQKATAAIASCSLLYHEDQANRGRKVTVKAIKETPAEKKFLLFCGDISGIQNFVYQISSQGAYKMLKGRSFFVQLLAELLARKYLEEFELTSANILFCSGGKFYLLLPNLETDAQRLQAISNDVNQELFDLFNGDLYLRTGWEEVSGNDLAAQTGRNLSEIWDDLARKVVSQDRQRYAEMADKDYDRLFGVDSYAKTDCCSVCHCSMETNTKEAKQSRICRTCLNMKDIGQRLKTSRYIVVSITPTALDDMPPVTRIFGKYLWFCDERPIVREQGCFIWTLNSTDFAKLVKSRSPGVQFNAGPLIVGGNHTFDEDALDLQFDDIAQRSEGTHRLGVLRMDVDNMGRIFREGLKNYRHQSYDDQRFHSLGRITTLSWQVAFFFGSMVPKCISLSNAWQGKATVVYAGGDDLFVLGAWHSIPEVALELKQQFANFCCHNPVFSLSGGMVITGGKFPIYKSAELAGEVEFLAKNNQTRFHKGRQTTAKESFTFLGTVMHWREFEAVRDLKDRLFPLLREKENRPLLGRLKKIYLSWSASRDAVFRRNRHQSLDSIRQSLEAEKWRWRMVYSLARFGEKHQSLHEIMGITQQFILNPVAVTDRNGIELLGVLSRWCELQLRTPENRQGEK